MADETVIEIGEFDLPFGRRAILRGVTHDSGLRMVRLILREGRRITQVDMDEAAARDLGAALFEAGNTDKQA